MIAVPILTGLHHEFRLAPFGGLTAGGWFWSPALIVADDSFEPGEIPLCYHRKMAGTTAPQSEYTVSKAARMLRVNPETIRRYIRSGQLRAMRKRIGGVKAEYRITNGEFKRFRRSKFWIQLMISVGRKKQWPPGATYPPIQRNTQLWKRVRSAYRRTYGEELEISKLLLHRDGERSAQVAKRSEIGASPEENMIIAAFENHVRQHRDELRDERIALGNRELTWDDVVAEMRQRTEFGLSYLQALAESAAERISRSASEKS